MNKQVTAENLAKLPSDTKSANWQAHDSFAHLRVNPTEYQASATEARSKETKSSDTEVGVNTLDEYMGSLTDAALVQDAQRFMEGTPQERITRNLENKD